MHPIIHFGGEVYVPSYILVISISYCFGIIWALARSKKFGMDRNECINLCFSIMLGGFLGARALHVFYEAPDFYLAYPSNIIKVWQGGFVFYGGALGALAAFTFWVRKRALDFWAWADLFAPILAAGYMIGRIACFLNGCCYGKICDLPWALHNPTLSEGQEILRHPTQLYASAWEFLLLAVLLHLEFWSRKQRVLTRFSNQVV